MDEAIIKRAISLEAVMDRIAAATPESPILVCTSNKPKSYVTAFGDTIQSRDYAEKGHDNAGNRVIGVFHGLQGRTHVKTQIIEHGWKGEQFGVNSD